MNTIMEGYVASIIAHANKVRATKSHEAEAVQTIEITDEWYDKLSSIPFVSCKYILTLTKYRAEGQDNTSVEGKFQACSFRKKEKKNLNPGNTFGLDATRV